MIKYTKLAENNPQKGTPGTEAKAEVTPGAEGSLDELAAPRAEETTAQVVRAERYTVGSTSVEIKFLVA